MEKKKRKKEKTFRFQRCVEVLEYRTRTESVSLSDQILNWSLARIMLEHVPLKGSPMFPIYGYGGHTQTGQTKFWCGICAAGEVAICD